jgi:hypothetical protein
VVAFRRPRTDARSALKSLPVEPDTFAKWKECRAGLDYHVEIDKH